MGSAREQEQGSWGPSGADRTQVGPMLAPWTLLSGLLLLKSLPHGIQGLVYCVWSIALLLMTCWRKEPGHQQQTMTHLLYSHARWCHGSLCCEDIRSHIYVNLILPEYSYLKHQKSQIKDETLSINERNYRKIFNLNVYHHYQLLV